MKEPLLPWQTRIKLDLITPEFASGSVIPLRYLFKSESRNDIVHVVDLEDWNGSGSCTCEHFEFRIAPLLTRQIIEPHTARSRCVHIRRAREIQADITIQFEKKRRENEQKKKRPVYGSNRVSDY